MLTKTLKTKGVIEDNDMDLNTDFNIQDDERIN